MKVFLMYVIECLLALGILFCIILACHNFVEIIEGIVNIWKSGGFL